MLIVFPLGLLATAVAFDIVGLVEGDDPPISCTKRQVKVSRVLLEQQCRSETISCFAGMKNSYTLEDVKIIELDS